MKNLLKSAYLLKLYRSGHLRQIIEQNSEYFNADTFMSCGKDCCTFWYDETFVIKICSKKISFFKKFCGDQSASAETLKIFVNYYGHPYFAPIGQIIHEDDYLFIYTQVRCQPFNRSLVTPQTVS